MHETVLRHPPFVLLDDSQPAHKAGPSLLFHSPDHIITAHSPSQVKQAFAAIDAAIKNGLHVAGYIAYEAAAAIEPKLRHIADNSTAPLVWMMATKHREELSSDALEDLLHESDMGANRHYSVEISDPSETQISYTKKINKIQDYILSGDVYQINYTFPFSLQHTGDSLALYRHLRNTQPVPYGAFIETGDQTILSLSPELFIERRGQSLTTRPMKGTMPRGRTNKEDKDNQIFLKNDLKSQAENLMIVDLIRNDLSRIADKGSVTVDTLFATEKYKSIIQMTSDVSASCSKSLMPSDLLTALFPCGSVTGAPKVRAMEIINQLEDHPRGVYCGAIGHFSPSIEKDDCKWTLNVPIRTLTLNPDGSGKFHVGSGIVADSHEKDEYEECLLKGAFFTKQSYALTPFHLFETMRVELDVHIGQFKIVDKQRHLKRAQDSATYFSIPFNLSECEMILDQHIESLSDHSPVYRTKLIIDQIGEFTACSSPFYSPEERPQQNIALSSYVIQSNDPFLFHKTSQRKIYTDGYKLAQENDCADLIYLNEKNQITEGSISTLFIDFGVPNRPLLTPTLDCGLLPGTLRSKMLEQGKAVEAILSVDDLKSAKHIYIGNNLRGLQNVTWSGLIIKQGD